MFLLFFGLEARNFHSQKYKKNIFWKKICNIFRFGTRKFHSLIYKEKYFLEKYQKFFRIGFFIFQACCWKLSQIALHISTFCFYVKRSNWNQECKAADILLFSISQNPDIFYFSNETDPCSLACPAFLLYYFCYFGCKTQFSFLVFFLK